MTHLIIDVRGGLIESIVADAPILVLIRNRDVEGAIDDALPSDASGEYSPTLHGDLIGWRTNTTIIHETIQSHLSRNEDGSYNFPRS